MANEVVRGGTGNFWLRQESSLGTSSATYEGMYLDEMPAIPTATRTLVENSIKGYRNPMSRGKPVAVEQFRPDAFRIKQRIRRAVTDGNTPTMSTLFQAGGWTESIGGATTTTGTPTTTAIDVISATGMAGGECVLIEVTPGVFHPVLIADLTSVTITPSIALSAAPAAAEVVEVMHALTPTTTLGYQVDPAKTLQIRMNTLGYFDDAVGDLAATLTGCALADIGAIEIGGVGTVPTIDYGFHVGDVTVSAVDIGADTFQDSDQFAVITGDAQFAFASNNAGSGIAALVSKFYEKLTFNTGLKVMPIPGTGGGGLNGLQAYTLIQTAPTCTIEAYFKGDAAFENLWWSEMEANNSSQYIHFIQPTRNLDHPAFGIWMPNCHLKAGSEPTFDATGDTIKCTATFEADLAAWGGDEDIDDVTAAPIVIAVSGEAA